MSLTVLNGALRVTGGFAQGGASAVNALAVGSGLRTVLFGDSETDWFHYPFIASSATYNSATQELVIVVPAVHQLWVGLELTFWSYSYRSIRSMYRIPISRIVSTLSFAVVIPGGLADVPNGALVGNTFFRTPAVRGSSNWVNMAQMLLGWPLNIVYNGAQSGDWSNGALSRVERDCLEKNPHLVIMNALGINDQTYNGVDATGVFNSEAITIQNNIDIFDAILDTGAFLIVGNVMPVAAGEARATIDTMDRVIRINDAIWRYSQGKPRMAVVDLYGSMVIPTNAVGLGTSNLFRSDFVHLGIRGALRAGALLATQIQKILAPGRSTLPQSLISSHTQGAKAVTSASALNGIVTVIMAAAHKWRAGEEIRVTGMTDPLLAANGVFTLTSVTSTNLVYPAPGTVDGVLGGTKVISRSNNLWRNNLLVTDTGGASGVGSGTITATKIALHLRIEVQIVTAGWVGTADVVADDSGFGNKQTLAITACTSDGTSGGSARTQFTSAAGATSFAAEMAGNGRSYMFECTFRLKSTAWANTPISDIYAQFQVVGSDGNTYTSTGISGWDSVETAAIAADTALHIRTPPIDIPLGVTVVSSNFIVWARHGAAISGAATLTLELARPAVVDVTAYRSLMTA